MRNMKTGKKVMAGTLAAIMVSSAAITAYAATEHWNDGSQGTTTEWTQWKTDWETIKGDYEKVSVNLGADESQLGFAWYSKTVEQPKVRIAKTEDMKDAVEFTGTQVSIDIAALDGYFSNKVTVKDLEKETQYYYQVFKNGEWQKAESIKTGNPDSFSFLYVGDPQIGACKNQISSENETMKNEIAARNDAFNWNKTLTNAMTAHPEVNFLLSAGDQVNTADREYEYAGYLNASALASLPVSTTIGNHDSGSYQYSYHFNTPNSFDLNDTAYALGHTKAGTDYYYTYGDALFIVIDTNNYNCATHRNVIEKAVKENEDKKWRIVMFHQDIYGSGLDHSDSDGIILRTQLTPIFDEFDIDVALQGHDHTYSRSYQLSGDGKEHTAFDKSNAYGEDYLDQNNCYTINSDLVTGTIVDPKGTVYMEANSSTGSKFYELIPVQQDYIAERSQTWTPSYSVVNMTETALTITTYDADTNEVLEGSSAYTIVKKADSSALAEAVEAAKKKLEDGKYTDDSVAKVNEAIKNAEEVIADEQSTSDKIAEATAYLNEAVAALEVKPEEPANDDTSSDDVSTPDDTSSDDASEPDDTSSDDTSSDDTSSDDTNTPDDTSKGDESKVDDNITNPDTGNLVSVAPFAAISALSAIALAGMVIPEAIKNKKSSK
ncbi:MAG: metallophosphoesterase [Ruminiclostridium sp.]